MNSTTWIISPNWVAWVLLGLATASLVAIAIRLWTQRQTTRPATNRENTPQSTWRNAERAMIWVSFVLSLVVIGCICCWGGYRSSDFSAVATVLGIFVTLLVGWNIYQVIETKDSLNDVIRLRSDFNNIRGELDVLHEMHEAYVLSIVAENHRQHGRSAMAFEDFMGSASIFLRDLEHYDVRFMTALSSMQTCVDDLYRPAMGNRAPEINQFLIRRDSYLTTLENLQRQAQNLTRFAEQAQSDFSILIRDIRNIQRPHNNFDEDEDAESTTTPNPTEQ